MSISLVLQVLIEIIAGLLLAMAAMIARQQRGLMFSTTGGSVLPGDIWELKRLGLQILNVSNGGVTK